MKQTSEKETFRPYIPSDKVVPEFTVTSVVLGILLAVVFGGANAYLGLRVGMTVSASIPAAVISMGVLRILLKRKSILENNMVQTIGSAGESLAAGGIFTLPALFMWAEESSAIAVPSFATIAILAISGGVLGVLFMVPLRRALIVEEYGVLPFPEGTACSEVLRAGEAEGDKSKKVFRGLGIAALYKFLADGCRIFPSEVSWEIPAYKGSAIGADVLPALVGVGYICGARVSSYLLGGAVLGWFVIMPVFVLVGGDTVLFPAVQAIRTLSPGTLWGSYVRYIGAGAVAAGGTLSLIKAFPLILSTFRSAVRGYGKTGGTKRTEQELPMKYVLFGILAVMLVLWRLPSIPVTLLSACLIVLFRILLCDRECAYGGTRRFVEQPGIRHGDRDASACVHRVEINGKYRHRGYDNCDCDRNGHLHHCGDGGGHIAGSEDRLYRRGDTGAAAGGRIDWCGCLRTCNRRCPVSPSCRMEIRFAGITGTTGNLDEDGRGRCHGRKSSVDADLCRCIHRSDGGDPWDTRTAFCHRIISSDLSVHTDHGGRSDPALAREKKKILRGRWHSVFLRHDRRGGIDRNLAGSARGGWNCGSDRSVREGDCSWEDRGRDRICAACVSYTLADIRR